MEEDVERLRINYKGFKRGEKDVLAVRDEAQIVLEEARRKGDCEVIEEVGDMLIDLEFYIEENMCKCCHRCPNC